MAHRQPILIVLRFIRRITFELRGVNKGEGNNVVDNIGHLADLVVAGVPRPLRGYLNSRLAGHCRDHLDL